MIDDEARLATMKLLAARAPQGTVCPSEVARALATPSGSCKTVEGWRAMMPMVHATVDQMLAEGLVQLSWRKRRLEARDGPYRIGHADRAPGSAR